VLATATRPPNWIIWGSFWNCGAPPESEIAVAIVTAESTVVVSVAPNAAIQSVGFGAPSSPARLWNTASAAIAPSPKLTTLNVNFSGAWRNQASDTAEPTTTART